jgi:hypothetical protein
MASFSSAYADSACLAHRGAGAEVMPQQKLTRLLELRAVIESLRCEHESRDPLLSWVIASETAAERASIRDC